jgi:hypothetical protein
VREGVTGRMKDEGGRMKEIADSNYFILHPSAFILSLTPSLTVGLLLLPSPALAHIIRRALAR